MRMNEDGLMNSVWKAEAGGVRLRDRAARGWIDFTFYL